MLFSADSPAPSPTPSSQVPPALARLAAAHALLSRRTGRNGQLTARSVVHRPASTGIAAMARRPPFARDPVGGTTPGEAAVAVGNIDEARDPAHHLLLVRVGIAIGV